MTTDREVLAELVALKDLKAQVEALSYGGFQGKVTSSGGVEWEDKHAECEKLKAEYARRKPLAWAAASARLALPEAVPNSGDVDLTERAGYRLVPESALRWLFGEEGEFEPPPSAYREVNGQPKLKTWWWRSEFRKRIAEALQSNDANKIPELSMSMFASKDDFTEARGSFDLIGCYSEMKREHLERHCAHLSQALAQREIDALAAPQINAPVADAQIREVFLAHGFSIKHGRGDLKPYVYEAARALLALRQINAPALPVAYVPVHPRNGPLWAMTTDNPDPQRLPSYPLMHLYADPINAPAPMSIKAKPLQWEQSGDDWHDKHLGFYVTHDPGDDPELPYAAAWGEGDTQNFATLDEAKGWCQADIDRWVSEHAINALAGTPALPSEPDSNAFGNLTERVGE